MKTIFALGAFLFIGVAQGATLKISAGSPPVIIDSQPIRCIVIDQTSKCTCGLFAGGWGIEGSESVDYR